MLLPHISDFSTARALSVFYCRELSTHIWNFKIEKSETQSKPKRILRRSLTDRATNIICYHTFLISRQQRAFSIFYCRELSTRSWNWKSEKSKTQSKPKWILRRPLIDRATNITLSPHIFYFSSARALSVFYCRELNTHNRNFKRHKVNSSTSLTGKSHQNITQWPHIADFSSASATQPTL